MRRLVLIAAVLGSAALAAAGPAAPAERPAMVDAPAPCVNSGQGAWRDVRDPILDAKSLRYCTGADCWSLDLATGVVSSAPARPPGPPTEAVSITTLTNDKGMPLATVDETHVEFCTGKAPCKTFAFSFANPASEGMAVRMNAARTLGAVLYMPDSYKALDPEVIAFDLVAGKQVGRQTAQEIDVLDHGFLVDGDKLYSAAWKPIGPLAAPDSGWKPLGSTDVIALRDETRGELVIQDTTTGKVRARIPTGAPKPDARYFFVVSPDAAKLYAIGGGIVEGEVLTIDVAAGKLVARAKPPACAAGTHRRT